MIYYYAFWIPQLKRGIPIILKQSLETLKLKDVPNFKPLFLQADINEETFDITLRYGKRKCRLKSQLTFRMIEKRKEGFLIYNCELPEDDEDYFCAELKKGLNKAVYHYFKGFFHNHQYHSKLEDSLLSAYSSTEPIIWSSIVKRSEIVKTILTSYDMKFAGSLDEMEKTFHGALNNLHQEHAIRRNVRILKQILRDNYNIIFGESKYCEFLLQTFTNEISKRERKKIRTEIYDLKRLYEDIEHWDNFYTSLSGIYSDRTSIRIGVFGFIISIISLGVTFGLDAYNRMEGNEDNAIFHKSLDSTLNNQQESIDSLLYLLQDQAKNDKVKDIRNKK